MLYPDTAASSHSLDPSFCHRQVAFPGVVVEVAHSPKRKDFKRLAHDYIFGSKGNIRMVVAFTLDYPSVMGKRGTVSV